MTTYTSNRDGGLTDEEGHYKFQTQVWNGNVADGLLVTENSPLGMSVLVNGGDAKIPYSDYAYTAWIPDASPEVATITTADPTNPRIDRVVMYIDRSESPQQVNPNNPGIAKIAVVAGTPGAVPNRPSDGTVDTAVSNNPWIDLADVLVNNGVTQITDSNITDTRLTVTVSPAQILAYNRQNITTNTTVPSPKIQMGWNFINGNGSADTEKAITFPESFSSAPVVIISNSGAKLGSDPTSLNDTDGAGVNRKQKFLADNPTTSGFTARMQQGDATNNASGIRGLFTWIAIGQE